MGAQFSSRLVLVQSGYSRTFEDGETLTVLNPERPDNEDLNNSSVVCELSYGGTSFLFMGDAEVQAEAPLVAKYDLDVDVLKVGHHGSRSSTSDAFLKEATPEISVISVGENRYGHPNANVLQRIRNVGSKIYRTDLNGTIVLSSNGSLIGVESLGR